MNHMNDSERFDALRRIGNPLFSDRKLKLGTFGTNLSGGCAMSAIEGTMPAVWSSGLALAQCADRMKFEAIVPVARWRGFGGVTDFNGESFESFSWAAGIGASTKFPAIFSTSHVPAIHPVMAAKQSTTIDHITDGRFCLNIVTGWYRPEIEMFGAPLMEHDRRYDYATEWLDIMKRLWTEEEPFDFEGEFFKVPRAQIRPMPIQKPHPAIMNAGGSERGMHFAAKNCDVVFVLPRKKDLGSLTAQVQSYRKLARESYGREISVWTNAYIVQGDTEDDAKAYLNEVINEKGDRVALENFFTALSIDSRALPPDAAETMKGDFIAGYGGYPLVGTSEQVVDGLATLAKAGFDGVLLSWPRYTEDMLRFEQETYPLLVQAGLR
jgi:FMNH2-dependent dimethyl sulfone monooxygenase